MIARPYGDSAILLELDDTASVMSLAGACAGIGGVLEVVPGARTLLLVLDGPRSVTPVSHALARLTTDVQAPEPLVGDEIVLDVVYDGADLASTADELGLDVAALVRAHTDASYVVAFCGFAPGFAYLTGLPHALHVPRLETPRTRVPAGSVAVAGEFAGVYPRESPGGWRLLGHTDALLWDVRRDPPALLTPGTRVRFRPAGRTLSAATGSAAGT